MRSDIFLRAITAIESQEPFVREAAARHGRSLSELESKAWFVEEIARKLTGYRTGYLPGPGLAPEDESEADETARN